MTAIGVFCPPPGISRITELLAAETILTAEEARQAVTRVTQDGCRAAHESGGPITYLPVIQAGNAIGWDSPESDCRSLVTDALPTDATPRIGKPISTEIPPVIDTIADLLANTSEASAGLLWPLTPLIQRRHLDAGAMRLRTTDTVIGPSSGPGWYFIGRAEGVSAWESEYPESWALPDLATRVLAAGDSVRLTPYLPGLHNQAAAATTLAMCQVADRADQPKAAYTRVWMNELGVGVASSTEGPTGELELTKTDR